MIFTLFTPELHPLGLGVMKDINSCLLQMLHTKFGQHWLSREGDVNGRRTTDGLQPIAIGLQSQVTYEVHYFDV